MELSSCRLCQDHHQRYSTSAIIQVDSKPSLDYSISSWQPENVKVLFLGEAPSFLSSKRKQINDSYFYNPHESHRFLGAPDPLLGTLSWNIFQLLGISTKLDKKAKLQKFKEAGYFYLEAVKCRIKRYDRMNLLNKTIKNCSQFLRKEIHDLQPHTIVVLGERALYSLSSFSPFDSVLKDYNLLELLEQTKNAPLIFDNSQLLAIPLPLWRNRNYLPDILDIFQQIKKL